MGAGIGHVGRVEAKRRRQERLVAEYTRHEVDDAWFGFHAGEHVVERQPSIGGRNRRLRQV